MKQQARRRFTREGTTRERMVLGAVDLLRRRGVTATSLREVVRHTGTPRGSIAHHFPGGKAQLLEEALGHARGHVSRSLQQALETSGTLEGMRHLARQWRRTLQSTGFEAGCPVMAVAIEHAVDETCSHAQQEHLLRTVQATFEEWIGLLTASLRREGLSKGEARSLAFLVISSFEGAIGMARAARSLEPLERVARELEVIAASALRQTSGR